MKKVLLFAVLALVAPSVMADYMFESDSGTIMTTDGDYAPYTLADKIVVGDSDMLVTSLGYADVDGGGLAGAHEVGIYDTSETLLASVTVPAGTSATLVYNFRFVDLSTSITLSANTTYYIAGFSSTSDDAFRWGSVGSTVFGDGYNITSRCQSDVDTGLSFPNQSEVENSYWGNMNMEYSLVPEPATMSLLVAGGLLAVIRRR